MAETQNKLSAKESRAIIGRSLRFLEKSNPGCMLRVTVSNTFDAIVGYAGIWLAAMVVDAISQQKPLSDMLLIAAIAVAVQLICRIIYREINRWKECHFFEMKRNMQKTLLDKVMTMDYVRMENPKTQDAYENAKRQLFGNMGIFSLYNNFPCALVSLLHIIIGLVLLSPIAFKPATVHGGFVGFIQSPWGLAVMLILVSGSEWFKAAYLNGKQMKVWEQAQASKRFILARRVTSAYWGLVAGEYRNGKDFRIYDESELILTKMDESAGVQIEEWQKAFRQSLPYDFAFQMMNIVSRILMYGFAVIRALSGMLTPGEVIAFALYFTEVQSGISQFSDCYSMVKISPPFCKQVFDFLDIPDEKYMGTIPTEKRTDNEYEFEFRHVWFKYPGCEEYALKDINLKWRIGEKMALVGRNGCGKSTLVKLLCRLYDPTKGEITLNGIDIRKYDYADYRALFSVVFQDSHLFSFSMAENVAASTEYDAERVTECVNRAGLGERLATMPHGINTCLYKDFDPEGVEISGGEEQKLCLARAIYKGAPFIVLDEPTAALDPISEHDIYTKFNSIVGTRTAIYISHRLSSCRFCDEITVMENGRIAERGSHESLLEQQGVYQKLWTAQAEYYKDTAGELYA